MLSSASSTSSDGGGNTISPPSFQISPAKRWCFTLNNYTEMEFSSIVHIFDTRSNFYIIGDEVGDSGTPHLQGYVEFTKKIRPASINKRIHWEKARGNRDDNVAYCSKQKVLAYKGLPKPVKIIEDLYPWQQEIVDLIQTEPDDRKVYWYWSDDGNIGKSALIKYCCVKHGAAFCCGGKYTDIMNLVFNHDMDKCNCIMFDIPRCSSGHISYSSIESIKNGLVCNTKYETGFKVFNAPHIIVFANHDPDVSMLSEDRWVITKLD